MSHILVAPFGAVQFKMYLLAEILTESPIQLEDVGKCFSYIINDNWNGELANMTQGSMADKHFKINNGLKWYFYLVSFLPYMFRMNQNLKKWLVYDHGEQAFNALKFFILMMAQIFAICYYETHIKNFKYMYYGFKFVGCTYKVFWDWHFDWGLFRGTKKSTPRFLRDKMKFQPWFYYCMMVFDVFALFFWVVIIFLYKYLKNANTDEAIQNVEFFN